MTLLRCCLSPAELTFRLLVKGYNLMSLLRKPHMVGCSVCLAEDIPKWYFILPLQASQPASKKQNWDIKQVALAPRAKNSPLHHHMVKSKHSPLAPFPSSYFLYMYTHSSYSQQNPFPSLSSLPSDAYQLPSLTWQMVFSAAGVSEMSVNIIPFWHVSWYSDLGGRCLRKEWYPPKHLFLALFLTGFVRFNRLYLNLHFIQCIQSLYTFGFETTLSPMQSFISHVLSILQLFAPKRKQSERNLK